MNSTTARQHDNTNSKYTDNNLVLSLQREPGCFLLKIQEHVFYNIERSFKLHTPSMLNDNLR